MAMTKDTLLSLDLGFNDCLYRIRRDEKNAKRVIYIVIKDLTIIPEEYRTCGPDVIRELSKLKEWYNTWNTLTVRKDGNGNIESKRDEFKPHALLEQHIVGPYNFFDILELRILQSLKTRVFRVEHQGRPCFLKIARFGFELDWLAREIKAYHTLSRHNSTLAPALLGYAFEGPHRVIGFIFEEVTGRRPDITDLGTCKTALQQLHSLNIIHGDINRDNIFITSNGAKFIDFEESSIGPIGSVEGWDKRKAEEILGLVEKLKDNSGKGRPWSDS
ncbi:hypothetical protein AJ80_09504 [Polytolypa hystricis UAMH7299]|uniref:Uncharacterized protein n=1 Tax=Polytolypa hystricis (strain UAMH7299) TaxID=1447883 RepID=A0A2B7WQ97_POLH7|nr:hypothetical protein AJ80_09504 [Polytolypa hystricis UAMH7299]